jgi:hypothetical protein
LSTLRSRVRVLGILVIIVWAVLCFLPLFRVLKKLGILRIDDEMETGGPPFKCVELLLFCNAFD